MGDNKDKFLLAFKNALEARLTSAEYGFSVECILGTSRGCFVGVDGIYSRKVNTRKFDLQICDSAACVAWLRRVFYTIVSDMASESLGGSPRVAGGCMAYYLAIERRLELVPLS